MSQVIKLSRKEVMTKVWGRPLEVSPIRRLEELRYKNKARSIVTTPKKPRVVPGTKLRISLLDVPITYRDTKIPLREVPRTEMLDVDFWERFGNSLNEEVYEAIVFLWHVHAEEHCKLILKGGPKAWEAEYRACKANKVYYMAYWWRIVDYNRRNRRLFMNPIQRVYWKNRGSTEEPEPYIDVILKARKQGLSTIILADFGHDVMFERYTRAVCLTHKMDASRELRRRFSDSVKRLPPFLRPATVQDNAAEMRFRVTAFGEELDSGFFIDSARAIESGRATDIDRLHLSEHAYYADPEATAAALMEAMREGGRIAIESTPNGDNDFAVKFRLGDPESDTSRYGELADAAGLVYRSHFFRWFDDPRYRIAVPKGAPAIVPNKEEKQLVNAYGLTDSQLNFRRRRMARYTAEGGRFTFLKDFPEDKRSCFILSAGGHVFDLSRLEETRLLLLTMAPPIKKQKSNYHIHTWIPVEKELKYIAGCDTSEGETGSNPAGVGILELATGEQVASLHGLLTPYELAHAAAELSDKYNIAMLVVERNNTGHAVLQELLHHIMYPNIYWHVPFAATKKTTAPMKPGWPTGVGKNEVIGSMREGLADEETGIIVNDLDFVDECSTFISDQTVHGNIRTFAQPGCYDDRVMYWSIAWHVRKLILLGRIPANMAPQIVRLGSVGAGLKGPALRTSGGLFTGRPAV